MHGVDNDKTTEVMIIQFHMLMLMLILNDLFLVISIIIFGWVIRYSMSIKYQNIIIEIEQLQLNTMQNIDLSSLIQVKLDFNVVQDALSLTIKDIIKRIGDLQSSNTKICQASEHLEKQTHKLYQLIQQSNQANGHSIKVLEDKFNKFGDAHLSNGIKVYEKGTQFPQIIQKTPKEILDHIENRLSLNLNNKQLDMNCSPPNTERVCQTFRVKEDIENQKDQIDQQVYNMYAKAMQKIEIQVTALRKDFRVQINEYTNKSMKMIDGKLADVKNAHNYSAKDKSKHRQNGQNGYVNGNNADGKQNCQLSVNKSHKVVVISTKHIESSSFELQPKSMRNFDNPAPSQIQEQQKEQIIQFINELKRQVRNQIQQLVKNTQQKSQEINRTNSVIADHLLQAKKSLEDLTNDKDALRLQIAGISQKTSSSQRQLCLIVDTINEHKNKFRALQSSVNKILEQMKENKNNGNETIKQQDNQDGQSNSNSSRKQFRDSHSSFRSSVANLGPIRNSSILKVNNNRVDTIQESLKFLSSKLTTLFDRINKMEDEKKKQLQFITGSLPKIDKQNKSNVNPLEIIKKQLKKVNDDIMKTNQKLTNTKGRLDQLYETHSEIPSKIQDIYNKLRENNELQQYRLIELIKQLINRILSDPFDNNFTNRLKRQINVKFLQIKYQYNCILKQIQSKVENRAEISQVQKITQKFEQGLLEAKSIASKKCDTEDFKKGIKYLQSKIKEVFTFAKSETVALANEQKQYIGAKKQPLH